MNKNITDRSSKLEEIHTAIRICKECRLCDTRNLSVPGEGPVNADIMFVGEAPGHVNDRTGRPFVGHGGKIFDGILESVGLIRDRIFITNAVKCWPPNNRKPKKEELTTCKEYLDKQIDLISPKIIFALGSSAFTLLTGDKISLKAEHGKIVYRDTIPVCALFHPNALRYVRGGRATVIKVINNVLVTSQSMRGQAPTGLQIELFNE